MVMAKDGEGDVSPPAKKGGKGKDWSKWREVNFDFDL